jgi:hypothetical protein
MTTPACPETRRVAANIAKLPGLLLRKRMSLMAANAIRPSVRLLGVRSSLQHVVRNIESKNVLVSFSLAFYLTVHAAPL